MEDVNPGSRRLTNPVTGCLKGLRNAPKLQGLGQTKR